jgi:type I restriction enzyme S subunit
VPGWRLTLPLVGTPLEEVADVNPRTDKSEIPDDLLVSFVPMPAVGPGDGAIDVSHVRPAGEVKKVHSLSKATLF